MDLQLTSTTYSGTNTSVWISDHVDRFPITIDASDLAAGDLVGDAFPGYLPDGFPLGKITADSTYAKYDNTNGDGTETLEGLLYGSVWIESATSVVHGAIGVRGVVDESKLPETVDSAGKADNSNIIYR